jgi:hypothetical protein
MSAPDRWPSARMANCRFAGQGAMLGLARSGIYRKPRLANKPRCWV